MCYISDMKILIEQAGIWANNNEGVLAVILFIFSVIVTLFIKDKVTKKFTQKGGKNSKNYQAENLTINNHE